MTKKSFMQIAFEQAQIAASHDEVPVGAVIVKDGEIIAQSFNQNRKLKDPSAHAEIMAMRLACEKLQVARLDGCDLYVTLEPCAMCAAAISLAKIRAVYYGLSDEKFGAVENGVRFFSSDSCFFRPQIYSGFMENEIRDLMRGFFVDKR